MIHAKCGNNLLLDLTRKFNISATVSLTGKGNLVMGKINIINGKTPITREQKGDVKLICPVCNESVINSIFILEQCNNCGEYFQINSLFSCNLSPSSTYCTACKVKIINRHKHEGNGNDIEFSEIKFKFSVEGE